MRPPKEPPYFYVNNSYGVNVGIGQRVHVLFDGTKFDVPVHPLDLIYDTKSFSKA